jgi:hypothetical protein
MQQLGAGGPGVGTGAGPVTWYPAAAAPREVIVVNEMIHHEGGSASGGGGSWLLPLVITFAAT